jgi:hypothetical protein
MFPFFIGVVVLLVIFGLVVLNVWAFPAWVQAEARRLGVYRKRFVCPLKNKEVEVDFLTRLWEPTDLLGVERCSACKKGEAMDCDRSCLRLPQAREAHPFFRRAFLPMSFPLI